MKKLMKRRLPAYNCRSGVASVRAYDNEVQTYAARADNTGVAGVNKLPDPNQAQIDQAHRNAVYQVSVSTVSGAIGGALKGGLEGAVYGGSFSFLTSAAASCGSCHR